MNDARQFLDQMSAGYQSAITLLTANHLGLFTALEDGPRTATQLAYELSVDARALEILLYALTAAGVLEQPSPSSFAMTEDLAPYLSSGGEHSLHSILDHHYHLLARWGQLADVVRTGKPAPNSDSPRNDRALRSFICGMKDISRRSSEEVADTLPDLGRCQRLLDLGGGPGTAAITFCRRWPSLTAVVYDLPEVTTIAQEEINAAGLTGRVVTLSGDFHTDRLLECGDAPFDAIYISNIIHSHSPREASSLLAKAVGVLDPGGLLVLKDFFLADSRTAPAFGSLFAVNMLVGTAGGKSYTWTETEALLADLGLVDLQRHAVAVNSGLITARKPL